ncbi:MAG: RelA/SpoT domain-containing protein [Magnetococcales bacterium]|nr:RelA/SpoT domain-containing protein [Magnetococcales bacterium]
MQNITEKDKLLCYEIESRSKAIEKKCQPSLEELSRKHKAYAFKYRKKGLIGICSKVSRKRKEGKKNYGPHNLTDIWACRYVTLFQSDIEPIIDDLIKLLKGKKIYKHDSPFQENALREVIICTNRPLEDPLSNAMNIYEKLNESGLLESLSSDERKRIIRKPENRESGYSSIHFTINVSVTDNDASPPKDVKTCFEIQLRDIFEEAWGEIQHKLIYSGKDDTSIKKNKKKQWWEQHLNALKTFADGCSQHASIIKDNAVQLEDAVMKSPFTDQISQPQANLQEVLTALPPNAPKNIISKITAAYHLLEQFKKELLSPGAEQFDALSNMFSEAYNAARPFLDCKCPNGKSISYHLKLESAYALYNSKEIEAQEESMALYAELYTTFPKDAVTAYRYGRGLLNFAVSDAEYEEAENILKHALENLNDEDSIIKEEKSALKAAINQYLALRQWYKVDTKHNDAITAEEAISYIDQAIAYADTAFDYLSDQPLDQPYTHQRFAHIISDILYYHYDRFRWSFPNPTAYTPPDGHKPTWDSSRIQKLLDLIYSPELSHFASDYLSRDSLMVTHGMLDQYEHCLQLAEKNTKELQNLAQANAGGKQFKAPWEIKKHLMEKPEKVCYDKALRFGEWASQQLDRK